MEFVSVGPVPGGPPALARELASARSRLAGRPLAIVFLPEDCDHRSFLREASTAFGSTIVGASTGGVAFTERGISSHDPVAAVLAGQSFGYEVALVEGISSDPRKVAVGMDRVVDGARKQLRRNVSLLTLADAMSTDGDELIADVCMSAPPHWRVFGGTAGDNWKFRRTLVFHDGEVYEDAAVLVALFTDCAPSIVAHHGWCPAEQGREMLVTSIDGRIIRTLDGRPAVEVYEEELSWLGLLRPGDDLVATMAKYELGAKTYGEQLKIRAPLGLEDGGVLLAAGLPTGTVVRVVTADPEQLIAAARHLSARTLEPLRNTGVRGALVFDCAARLQLLRDRYREEVIAFSGGRSFPMVGTTCYGEIAKFGGSIEGFHNSTAVMAAW